MHKVLLIAYNFPPFSAGGVMRPRAFAKYLPRYGWQPIVLTVADRYYFPQIRDETLLTDLPDEVIICRTCSLEPRGKIASDFRTRVYGVQKQSVLFERLIKPTLRQLYYSLVIPDERILWLPYAVREGLQLVEQYEIDAILVTTPPHSAGVIGSILSQLTHTPLIWDVRDDWVDNPLYDSGSWLRRTLSRILERQLVRTAHRVVTVTRESVDAFEEKYPSASPAKFAFIPNGFDEHELAAVRSGVPSNLSRAAKARAALRVIYIGSMNLARSPIGLFEALKQLDLKKGSLELDIYGYARADFQEISAAMGLGETVRFHGSISRVESLRQLILSDAALMIIPREEGSRTAIPGKLYEYIGAQKFVLGLCPSDSAAGTLVRELHIGIVCSPDDAEQIKRALQGMLNLHAAGRLTTNLEQDRLRVYERSAQVRRLAGVLHETVEALVTDAPGGLGL